jgi:hypothetical protein
MDGYRDGAAGGHLSLNGAAHGVHRHHQSLGEIPATWHPL